MNFKTIFILFLVMIVISSDRSVLRAEDVTTKLQENDKTSNSWERMTTWLRKRKNPFRTSRSDIVTRGRRPIGWPPQVIAGKVDEIEEVGQGERDRRFFTRKERQFKNIQDAYDREDFRKVVTLSKDFVNELGGAKVGPDYIERQQELLRVVKMWRDSSREKVELLGMKNVELNLKKMKQAFEEEDYGELKKYGSEIERFVTEWEFSKIEREKKATEYFKISKVLLHRALLREEFSKLTIGISFRIISQNPNILSSAVINGKSKREGDVLDEKGYLVIKKINKLSILFEYKGELIEYDME